MLENHKMISVFLEFEVYLILLSMHGLMFFFFNLNFMLIFILHFSYNSKQYCVPFRFDRYIRELHNRSESKMFGDI